MEIITQRPKNAPMLDTIVITNLLIVFLGLLGTTTGVLGNSDGAGARLGELISTVIEETSDGGTTAVT